MDGVTVIIEVHPIVGIGMDADFADKIRETIHGRKVEFDFKGTIFQMDYNGNHPKGVKLVLHDLDAPLPTVFQRELTVSSVSLRATATSRLHAKTGWYDGDKLGFPEARCCIDPKGKHPSHRGRPQIYAGGHGYASTIGLFKQVLAGRLTPGVPGNRWAGMPTH
jgi:hypothetical protein